MVKQWGKLLDVTRANARARKDQPLPAKESSNHPRALEAESICILPEASRNFEIRRRSDRRVMPDVILSPSSRL